MGDNTDKFKNDKRDVTNMGLIQANRASVTKLSGMNSTDRKQKWEKIKRALKRESGSDSHSFRHTEDPPHLYHFHRFDALLTYPTPFSNFLISSSLTSSLQSHLHPPASLVSTSLPRGLQPHL